MRAPGVVDVMAAVWTRLFPARPVPARMPVWLRRADIALTAAALIVVGLNLFGDAPGPLRGLFRTDDEQFTPAGQVLIGVSCPCGIFAGIALARVAAALDERSLRRGLPSLDGWFPLRGRWLGLVFSVLLGLLGGGLLLFGLAQPLRLLFPSSGD